MRIPTAAILLAFALVFSIVSSTDVRAAEDRPALGELAGEAADSVAPASASEQAAVVAARRAVLDRLPAEVVAVASRVEDVLRAYVQIDTTNPPGNEIDGARYLATLLEAEGFNPQVFESEPGRGSVYVRLKGTGKKRPIVLLSHIDVVPANEAEWEQPPLKGNVVDGVMHGRGTLDCKGVGSVQALALIALKRAGIKLDRDVILLATAGEETGGSVGAGWFVKNHAELIEDAEFVLNEGGAIHRDEGKPLLYNFAAAEKGPCWFRVRATGEPGHGSRPAADTAVTRLLAALANLTAWERPIDVGPVVAGYFAAYAEVEPGHARQLRQLERALDDTEFREWFMGNPAWAALVQNTLAPTVLKASPKTNIVPSEASAEIDSRLLPGHSCEDFLAEVRERVAGEHVKVESLGVRFPSSQSDLDNALTRAVEKLAAEEPGGAVVLPGMLTGFTDSHYFRALDMAAYGFTPLVVDPEQRKTLHAPNERVDVVELEAAVGRLVRLLEYVSQ